MVANRVGKCGRKRKTSPRTDRKIVQMALKGIRTSCRNFSTALAVQGIGLARRTVKDRLLESGMKAYHPRNKPLLNQPLMEDVLSGLRTMFNGLLSNGRR